MKIRRAERADYSQILNLFKSSFPEPGGWWNSPARTRHYAQPSQPSRYGELCLTVAESDVGSIVGCICFQRRHNGDLYVAELAANPADPGQKRPLTGTSLLVNAMEHGACEWASIHTTLGVTFRDARVRADFSVPGRCHDLIRFYGRLGFELSSRQKGYTIYSDRAPAGTTWLAAPVERVHTAALSRLEAAAAG